MSAATRPFPMMHFGPLAVCAVLAAAGSILSGEDPTPFASGLQVDDAVTEFYVRAVTGPLRNKSVCYVCRNADRPVVMILARDIDPELKKLLKDVDLLVDQHRGDGLRSFGVFVTSEGPSLSPRIQTLAFDEKLALPLTLSVTSAEGPAGQKLHPDAAVTVVLYREQTVVANFAYRRGELDASQRTAILDAARKLAEGKLLPTPKKT